VHETIISLPAQMPVCGGISSTLLSYLCSAAEAELDRHLLTDVTPTSLGVRYITAAAMLAASMAVTVSGSREESMKAGNLSVSDKEGGRATAAALRSGAYALLAGSIKLDDFAVLEVEL